MRARAVNKTWGTWYTSEGERADAWPDEVRNAGGPGVSLRDALVSGSRHGMAGGGPGLHGFVGTGLLGRSRNGAKLF